MSLKQSNPLVTVYIPTFNRVELLKRAVDSVRNQTYKNLEIIVVDDCSKDGTHKYLEAISQEDPRLRYFIKEKNSGACVSRNIAIYNAKGEFITGLDDDDYFLKNRIAEFITYIDLLEKNVFIYTSYLDHNNLGNSKTNILKSFCKKNTKKEDLLYFNSVGNQIFVKTEILRKTCFDINMPAWQDLSAWYSLLNNGGGACLINSNSYVIDTTHSHERLTLQKKEKIYKAYKIFVEKFDLNIDQRKILFTQLQDYGYKVGLNKILYLFLSRFCVFNLILMISRLKKWLNKL